VLGTLAPIVFGLIAARRKKGRGKKVATFLFSISVPLLCLLIFFAAGSRVLNGGPHAWDWQWFTAITGALVVWGWLFVDINDFSPHGYYRDRLCECYLAARRQDQTGIMRGFLQSFLHGRKKQETARESGIGTLLQLPLSQMNDTGAAPYHLVNTAVNLPASQAPDLRGRDCDFFVFSRYFCGGPLSGYLPTKTLERLDRHLDLGTAMAVSGAAASSNMGVQTMRHLRFLPHAAQCPARLLAPQSHRRSPPAVECPRAAVSFSGDDRLDARTQRLP
jgi:hypothetical protein